VNTKTATFAAASGERMMGLEATTFCMARVPASRSTVYVRSEDAFVALGEILGDEPDWTGLLSVVAIELDERDLSAN
jgi:hypothetical protein